MFYRESLQYHRESLLTRIDCALATALHNMAAAWNNCGTEFCPIDQRDLELRSIEDELSVLESQIQGLLEKHSQLYEQKTMLETSQVKDTLREHRFEAP